MQRSMTQRVSLVLALCAAPLLTGAEGCDEIFVGDDPSAGDGGGSVKPDASIADAGVRDAEPVLTPVTDGGYQGELCEGRCPPEDFCVLNSCGGGSGICEPRPEACTQQYDPVCGCDGTTYGNACMANLNGITVAYRGTCPTPDAGSNDAGTQQDASAAAGDAGFQCQPEDCGKQPAPGDLPMCEDGTSPTFSCTSIRTGVCEWTEACPDAVFCGGIAGFQCPAGSFCDYELGTGCVNIADASGYCRTAPDACITIYAPVCGCDGVTYSNECSAHAAGVSVADPSGPCN